MKTVTITEEMLTGLCEIVLVAMGEPQSYVDTADKMDISFAELDLIISYAEATNYG